MVRVRWRRSSFSCWTARRRTWRTTAVSHLCITRRCWVGPDKCANSSNATPTRTHSTTNTAWVQYPHPSSPWLSIIKVLCPASGAFVLATCCVIFIFSLCFCRRHCRSQLRMLTPTSWPCKCHVSLQQGNVTTSRVTCTSCSVLACDCRSWTKRCEKLKAFTQATVRSFSWRQIRL